MENTCIFCGKILRRFQKKSLHCGNSSELVCSDCFETYEPYNNVERAYLALEQGRPVNREGLREFTARMNALKEEKRAMREAEDKKRVSDKKCLRCDGRMLNYGPITVKLGEETCFMSDINRLMSGSLDLEILRCENCGKVEFFIPDDTKLREMTRNQEE